MPYPRPKPPAGSVKANYTGFIAPALATSITKGPSGDRWIHEVKFDGYRVQVHIVNEAVRIFHPARVTTEPTVSKNRGRMLGMSTRSRRSSMAR